MKSRSKKSGKRAIAGLRKLRGALPADVGIAQLVREDRESGHSQPTFHPRRDLKLRMALLREKLALVAKGELRVTNAVRAAIETRLTAMSDEAARSARRTGDPLVPGVDPQTEKPSVDPELRAKARGAFLDEWEEMAAVRALFGKGRPRPRD